MYAKWANSLKDSCRVGLTALSVAAAFLLSGGPAFAQAVGVDVQLGASDRTLSQVTSIEADAGQTVVVEVFATGYSGEQGVEAIFMADNADAIVDSNGDGNPDVQISGGAVYSVALPAINGPRISGSFSTFSAPPTENDSSLKFIGSYTMTMSSSLKTLNLTLIEVKFGTSQVINPNNTVTIINPNSLPRSLSVDLDPGDDNAARVAGRFNPGDRIPLQFFGSGLRNLVGYEIEATVSPGTGYDLANTRFFPRAPFVIDSAGSASTLPPAQPSSGTRGGVDIQIATPGGRGDGVYNPSPAELTVEGGERVAVEVWASGGSGFSGLTLEMTASNIGAIRSVAPVVSSAFPISLPGTTRREGNKVIMSLGLLGTTSLPEGAPQLVGTVLLNLESDFNGLSLSVNRISLLGSEIEEDLSSGAVLNLQPVGGIRAPVVEIDGNTIRARASIPASTTGEVTGRQGSNVRLGRLSFLASKTFRGGTITINRMVFIPGGENASPIGTEPNITVNLSSFVTDAPVVKSPPVIRSVSDTRALITWETNKNGSSTLIYGTNPTDLNQQAGSDGLVRQHRVELTGLTAGTRYFFQVLSTDSQGRESTPFPERPGILVTRRVADTFPPRVVRGPAAVGLTTTGVTLLVGTDEASTLDITYGTSADALDQSASSSTARTNHEVRLTDLTPGATYFYKVRLTDLIGNTIETPEARQFRLRLTADGQPPRIVGRPAILGATFNAAVIGWITTEPSNSAIFHGIVSGNPSDSVVVDESVKQHSIALSNLLSDTTYYYTVRSIDASGNAITSPEFRFRTRSGEDTSAPRITRPPVVARRSDTEALIVFETNEPATAAVQVGTDIAVASDTTGVEGETFTTTDPVRRHEVRLTNLDAATVYFYRVSITDITGNGPTYNRGQLSFATLSVADTSPPVVFSRPVALGITEEGASINWAADEPHSAIIRYRVAAATKQDVGEFDEFIEDLDLQRRHAVPLSGLTAGTRYEYEVETIDAEGNSSTTKDLSFVTRSGADTAAPTIVRGPRVQNITSTSATVQWGTDEPADTRVSWGTTVEYDETIEVSEGVRFHQVTLTDLDPSTEYHYAVGSADASGNVVTTDASGTVVGLSRDHTFRTRSAEDEDPPVITEGPLAEIRNNLVILKWRTDELSTSRVAVGVLPGSEDASVEGAPVFGEASQIIFDDNLLTRNHVVTVTGLSPGLDYLFQVSSTDAFGNTVSGTDPTLNPKLQPPGGFGSFTTTTEEDTQFPVITSGPTVVASTSSSLTIEWATDESSNGTVDFGTDENALDAQEVSGTNETTHRMVLTKLATGTTYAYQVGSTDASGNGATKSAVVFASTAASEDLTAPVISTTPSVIYVNDRQATISWQTNEAADAEVSFGTAADQLLEVQNEEDFNTTHSITLTNLTAGTTYYYQVSSRDQNNNGPAKSAVLEFSTEALPDTAPPVSSNITAATTSTEALITWTTDELSDSAVRYGTQSGSLDFNTGDSEDVTAHAVTLTNLTPGTTYTYTVESIDRAGNQGSASTEATFTTLAEGETPTVEAPTAATATAGNGAVQLTWSSASGALGAIVERSIDGGAFASVATLGNVTSYTDDNVTNGVSYTYRVRALGLNQTQSEPSTASEAVTPADGIGPSIPVLAVKQGNPLQPTFVIENSTPLNDGDALNYTFQLSSSADFTDAIALDSGLNQGAGLGSSDPAGLTAWTVSKELTDGTTYHYRVKASDGTFDSGFLTGQFTVDAGELPYIGDIDGDFNVGFGDFLSLVGTFNKGSEDAAFNANADFNGDGAVDFTDFLTFVGKFGTTFIRGEDASEKPVIAMTYGIDAHTRFELVGRPMSSEAGGELLVEVHAKGAEDMLGSGFRLTYDTDALSFVDAFQGNDALLSTDDRRAEMFATLEHDPVKGEVFVAGAITEGGAVSGDGVVSRLTFVLKTDHPQGDLINLAEGLVINGDLNVNTAQNLGARLALVPKDFVLEHNFPNPFNPETTIRYAIPEAAQVRLVVYNVLGQEVVRLVDGNQVPGFYALRWDGKDTFGRGVASGVYLYKIHASGETQKFSQVHKMLLLK